MNIRIRLIIINLILPVLLFCFDVAEAQSSHVCLDRPCTEPVTKLKVGKFSFSADLYFQDFMGGEREECKDRICDFDLKFGVPGKMISHSSRGSQIYRIINGPLPLKLTCGDAIPAGFSDLPLEATGWQEGRFGHPAYYKNPPNQTFPFFSKQPNSIGVLIEKWGVSGRGASLIYVFDTETGRMSVIESGVCGYGIDFISNPEGVVSGYVHWKQRHYFGPPNFAAIYINLPTSYKDLDGQDLSLARHIFSNPSSVIPQVFQSIQINVF